MSLSPSSSSSSLPLPYSPGRSRRRRAPATDACANPSVDGACHNVPKALRLLKLIAIPTILVASVIGVCLPLFSRSVPALRPDRNLFVIVKAFASGVILATGYMHVLPDSFNNLTSPCLPKKPWGDFSFTAFVAMLAALFTLMVDSLTLTFYNRKRSGSTSGQRAGAAVADQESTAHGHWHSHGHGHGDIAARPRRSPSPRTTRPARCCCTGTASSFR